MPSQENASLSGRLPGMKAAHADARRKTCSIVAIEGQRVASEPGCGNRKLSSAPVWNRNLYDGSMRRHRLRSTKPFN